MSRARLLGLGKAVEQAGRSAAAAAADRTLPAVWGLDSDDSRARTWQQGAEGEAATGKLLAGLPSGYRVLHDRAIVDSDANLDHVVLGPTGVYLIDTKNYSGALTERDGEWLHNGHPITDRLATAAWEARMLSTVLGADVEIVLCVHGARLPAAVNDAEISAVPLRIVAPDALLGLITGGEQRLDSAQVRRLARNAKRVLPPAGTKFKAADLAAAVGKREAARLVRWSAAVVAADVAACRARADALGAGTATNTDAAPAPDLSGLAHPGESQQHAVAQLQAAVDEHSTGFLAAAWDDDWTAAGTLTDDSQALGLTYIGGITLNPVDDAPEATAALAVPFLGAGHLLLEADHPDAEAQAAESVRGILLRTVAAVPAGSIQITVYDPAGIAEKLAPFAELNHGSADAFRVVDRDGLRHALSGLVTRIGSVVKAPAYGDAGSYPALRAAAGHRRQPWHVLVMLGAVPEGSGSTREAHDMLAALAERGPLAGVHVLTVAPGDHDPTAPEPANTAKFSHVSGTGWWSRTYLATWQREPDPSDALIRSVCRAVAAAAEREASAPVALRQALPSRPGQSSSQAGLSVALGTDDAGQTVSLTFDDQTVHALVGGSAGSGKSNLILAAVYGLAYSYPPEELQMYLLDFKEGLEFARFRPADPALPWLPQARVVGLNSDREFGLAMLTHLVEEMQQRAVLLKRYGASSVTELKAAHPDVVCPRLLCVIDEFQVLLQPDDHVAKQAVAHLETLARKGRAYGLHLVLASQTLSGISALWGRAASIFDQFRTRIALQTSAGESQVILGPLNDAAAALTRRGQAVFNAQAGNRDSNRTVNVVHADAATTTDVQRTLHDLYSHENPRPYLFDSDAPARVEPEDAAPDGVTSALVGLLPAAKRTVAAIPIEREAGRNIAVLGAGQQEAEGVLAAAVRGVLASAPGPCAVMLVDCTSGADAETPLAAGLRAHASNGTTIRVRPGSQLRDVLAEAADGLNAPQDHDVTTLLVIVGAHRVTGLARKDTATGRNGAEDLRAVLRGGPANGVHVFAWWANPKRYLEDVGPTGRDDVAGYVVLKAQSADLVSILGHSVTWTPRDNRALVFDRERDSAPHLVVPFALGTAE